MNGGDGASFLTDFTDLERNERCTFSQVSDAPDAPYYCIQLRSVQLVYADENCETVYGRLVSQCDSASPGDLVAGYSPSPDGCGATSEFFELGPSATVETLYEKAFPDGACQPVEGGGAPLHELLPADLGKYVKGTLVRVPTDSDIEIQRVEGDDGSFLNIGLEAQGKSCRFMSLSGQGAICGPTRSANVETASHADPECQGPNLAFSSFSPACGEPAEYAIHYESVNGCQEMTGLSRLDAPVDSVYYQNGDACNAIDVSPPSLFYTLGESVSADSFPALTLTRKGSGRLTVEYTATPDGQPLLQRGAWFDTALNVSCIPKTIVDGSLRCLPPPVWGTPVTYFADPECTAMLHAGLDSPCTAPSRAYAWELEPNGSCQDPVQAVFELEPCTGDAYTHDPNTGECIAAPEDSARRLYQQGRQLDFSELAPIALE